MADHGRTAPREGTGAGPNADVLVVDDDGDVRGAIVDYLGGARVGCVQACDGQDAEDQLRAGLVPCVVVVDADMPRVTGPALVSWMREHATLRDVPVITMSAGRSFTGFESAPFLAKPFPPSELVRQLFAACRACGLCDRHARAPGSLYVARESAAQAPVADRAPPRRAVAG
jgi:DNA-binding response OmpR family regulator